MCNLPTSRVTPTSHFMSATVKKPEQAADGTRQQRCCPCSWGAYIKGNVFAARDSNEPSAPTSRFAKSQTPNNWVRASPREWPE